MKIIPAIDIIDGQCVRLTQGNYTQKKIYSSKPLEVAQSFEDAGLEQLHLVDLDGAKAKYIVNYDVLESIAQGTNLRIDFGGGVKSIKDLEIAFNSGANQVTAGSIAVANAPLVYEWIATYGSSKIILGADVKGLQIAVNGWKEVSEIELFPFLENYLERGIESCICTDIAKDGLLQGASIALYKSILNEFPNLKLMASGGVSSIDEIKKLDEIGCHGVVIGKAFYEGKIKLKEVEKFIVSC
ncbi:1-(5-phosphoribosyl)-5-[(5-phosphoribosylamino)methylideneamino]imidazole-4-carboxamide isomerase [Aureispira anguillae]|uniref:1-(5-phosphoribosyl)-5-[(5- phosphoribosylamino)methylideneamino]imidazole-4- carboxamide isomerase n=1 Tax=Aureispira anguillae TaxID=2864201 RepID=UPI003898EDEF